jgi:outer membrane protein OmpA-like peptidoglycan-associated protein
VASRPPGWKYDQVERPIGEYTYQVDETPFRFRREISLRLLAELEQGMTPVFSFKDWGDGRDNVTAALSVVRFLEAQAKFRSCVGQLIPYDYDKVRNNRIYFATAKYSLSKKAKRQLDGVIAYLLRDPSVKKAHVEGHADELGTHAYNNELSEQRALAVRDYLLQHKVPAEKLVVRYFGKRKPAKNNSTDKGRALNRRVSVKLVRE